MAIMDTGVRPGQMSALTQPETPNVYSFCTRLTLEILNGKQAIAEFHRGTDRIYSDASARFITDNTTSARSYSRIYTALFENLGVLSSSLLKLRGEMVDHCKLESSRSILNSLVKDYSTLFDNLGTLVQETSSLANDLQNQHKRACRIGSSASFFKDAASGEALVRYHTADVLRLNAIKIRLQGMESYLARL